MYYLCSDMKRLFTTLLIGMMAALVFYGGAGVNVASYCCDDCRSQGVEVLVGDMCCDVHEHEHAANDCSLASGLSCSLERVNFEWTNAYEQSPDMHPAAFQLFDFGLSSVALLSPLITQCLLSAVGEDPPPRCPRVYLSLLTSLLI